MMHFPLLGAAIGFWGVVFFNAAAVLFPPAVAAAASTLATVHITGCFHEDGLADVFDGFGGEPEQPLVWSPAATQRSCSASLALGSCCPCRGLGPRADTAHHEGFKDWDVRPGWHAAGPAHEAARLGRV